jgi:hypothetical protein
MLLRIIHLLHVLHAKCELLQFAKFLFQKLFNYLSNLDTYPLGGAPLPQTPAEVERRKERRPSLIFQKLKVRRLKSSYYFFLKLWDNNKYFCHCLGELCSLVFHRLQKDKLGKLNIQCVKNIYLKNYSSNLLLELMLENCAGDISEALRNVLEYRYK